MSIVAYVITSHGYGHAARSCAVMQALLHKFNHLHFLIFSQTPRWFFEESLPPSSFTYLEFFTDVGLVQQTPFKEDVAQTLKLLQKHFPISRSSLHFLKQKLQQFNAQLVISDISLHGILVGKQLDLPTILIENFTWDWIYQHYTEQYPALQPFVNYFKQIYQLADFHFKVAPFADNNERAFKTGPIARPARQSAQEVRRALKIKNPHPIVLISTGGVSTRHHFISKLKNYQDFNFVVPHDVQQTVHEDNLVILPHRSSFYHPDLVAVAEIVVCKAGYSTVAETYLQQKRVILVRRPSFPESPIIEQFVTKNLINYIINPEEFNSGWWIKELQTILNKNKVPPVKITDGTKTIIKQIEPFLN